MDKEEISLFLYLYGTGRILVWNNFIIAITGNEDAFLLQYDKICLALEKFGARLSDANFNSETRLIFESEDDKLEFMISYG